MNVEELYLTMRDNKKIYTKISSPENKENALGVICIVHGSCEHSGRYYNLIKFLVDNNYIVYSYDLRGHGLSEEDPSNLGYFGDKNGWEDLILDLDEIITLIKKDNQTLKINLLGHSMGSFIARHYAINYSNKIDKLIVIGTGQNPKLTLKIGKMIAGFYIKTGNEKHRNHFLNKLSYSSFNKNIKDPKTPSDWITKDTKVVEEYRADDLCGFTFTSAAFKDMFDGLLFITDKKNVKKLRSDLPILLISGSEDPVGNNGKMVYKAYNQYKDCRLNNVEIKIYDGMRHEILNEINKYEVYKDILCWVSK